MDEYRSDRRSGMLLTGDIATMSALAEAAPGIRCVTVGGIHLKEGRVSRLRYVFLTPDEDSALRALEARGIAVVAQDVPAAAAVPLAQLLAGDGRD
jgi:mannose/fructose/N-acetylgalactosamine-specific phosphotransferase system component IIB